MSLNFNGVDPSINGFYREVREILATRDLPSSHGRFENTCEEIQISLQLAATLSRDYVTMSHEVFSAALNILSQHRQLESDLNELAMLRERLEQQVCALKLSEERNIRWMDVLRALSQKLEVFRRENHAISEGTLNIIARLSNDRLRLSNESDLSRQLQKISNEIVRGDEPFSMKILTRLKRLEYHHAISQDVSALQLIFSRLLMRRNCDLQRNAGNGLLSCFGPKSAVKDPQVIDLLSRIVTIGSTLHAEVKQLEEVNRLMRIRQDLMYREYMERQNSTYAILWEIQAITSELHALDQKNDLIVGKIVKSRPDFSVLQRELDRVIPKARPFSKRVLRMHPELFSEALKIDEQQKEQQQQQQQQRSSTSEKGESWMDKILKDKDYDSVLPSRETDIPETVSNLVSDVKFDDEPVISSPEVTI